MNRGVRRVKVTLLGEKNQVGMIEEIIKGFDK